ncbi:putative N-acetyltransferase YhbS [Staphylococcus hominis]
MQVYLSTLTEMDYIETLEKLEKHDTNSEDLNGKSHSKMISNLRKQPTYNYELEVIAKKEDGEIIGHIMLNEVDLIDNKDTFKVLQLSSLIVAIPYRNQGIGKALVQAVEERAKSHHYTAIIVDCCPDYFTTLGYESAAQHRIISEHENKLLYVKFLWNQLSEYPHGKLQPLSIEI